MQTKTCFKLETEMLRNLKSLAFQLNVSMAEIIRQAICEYLERKCLEKPNEVLG